MTKYHRYGYAATKSIGTYALIVFRSLHFRTIIKITATIRITRTILLQEITPLSCTLSQAFKFLRIVPQRSSGSSSLPSRRNSTTPIVCSHVFIPNTRTINAHFAIQQRAYPRPQAADPFTIKQVLSLKSALSSCTLIQSSRIMGIPSVRIGYVRKSKKFSTIPMTKKNNMRFMGFSLRFRLSITISDTNRI